MRKAYREKVVLFPNTLPFIGVPCSTVFKIRSCFLMNVNRDYVSLETEFCFVCVFLIVTPSKLFALVFDFSARIRLFRFAQGQP